MGNAPEHGNRYPLTCPSAPAYCVGKCTPNFRHIPLVDESGRVVVLALLSELVPKNSRSAIMAGGLGTRPPIKPMTCKPMLLWVTAL